MDWPCVVEVSNPFYDIWLVIKYRRINKENEMIKIGLRDLEFEHIKNPTSFCGYDPPAFFEWDRETPEKNRVVSFSDRCLEEASDDKYKDCIRVAWRNEPFVIHEYSYGNLESGLHRHFQYCLTHNKSFINYLSNNTSCQGIWYPNGGSWFFKKRWGLDREKNKLVSIIASNKTWTEGHRLRHEVIKKLRPKIDFICGKGYMPVEDKMVAFDNFKYQIVIENCDCADYWTDKLIDCFATGVIPIFWGGDWLDKYFDIAGILRWKTTEGLEDILNTINKEDYESRKQAIINNYDTALNHYAVVEDYLWNNFFKEIV